MNHQLHISCRTRSLERQLPALPHFILALYTENILRSPRGLTEPNKAAKQYNDEVAIFCRKASAKQSLTRTEVRDFITNLKRKSVIPPDDSNGVYNAGADKESNRAVPGTNKTQSSNPKSSEKSAIPRIEVRIGQSDDIGYLDLDQASTGTEVFVVFNQSSVKVEMHDLNIVRVTI